MKTKIFAYKGILGAETDLKKGKFLNKPLEVGQLGCIISTSEVKITKEAIELLKKAPREGGSFAPIMLTKHSDGESSISLMGFHKHLFEGEDLCIGKICDTSILENCSKLLKIPQDFINYIDKRSV